MAAPTQLIFSAASCFPVLVHSCHSGDCDGRCGCTVDFAGELRLEQVISANSSPVAVPTTTVIRTTSCTTMPELLEENEKLRKENAQLNNELSQLKGLCNNILALMTNYASGQLDNVSPPEGKTVEVPAARKADEGGAKVEEAEELDLTPRLFGVSIGAKRARREEEEEQNQLEQQEGENEPGSDVKSEPLDANNDHHQEPPWLELGKS